MVTPRARFLIFPKFSTAFCATGQRDLHPYLRPDGFAGRHRILSVERRNRSVIRSVKTSALAIKAAVGTAGTSCHSILGQIFSSSSGT
jgi:hypothetical protein